MHHSGVDGVEAQMQELTVCVDRGGVMHSKQRLATNHESPQLVQQVEKGCGQRNPGSIG